MARFGRPGSIRGEAAARGVSEHVIRRERSAAEGFSPSIAGGHQGGIRQARKSLRTAEGLRSASEAQIEARNAEFEALRRVRAGEAASIGDAERQLGLPRGSVRKGAPTAFDSRGNVKAADREPALMNVVGPHGVETVIVRGSRARSLAGRHWYAVGQVLRDDWPESRLDKFRGKKDAGIELECDEERLRALFPKGLPKTSPYPRQALR